MHKHPRTKGLQDLCCRIKLPKRDCLAARFAPHQFRGPNPLRAGCAGGGDCDERHTLLFRDLALRTPKRFRGWWLLLALVAAVMASSHLLTGWSSSAKQPLTGNVRPSTAKPRGAKASPRSTSDGSTDNEAVLHVWAGTEIQEALERAAKDPARRIVRVHAGVYRPQRPAQAMIYFNARHEGITLEAEGDVILTAANPEIADATVASFPAVVNHVVYFGDGISRHTILRGFKITGAKNFVTNREEPRIETEGVSPPLRTKKWVYYADGGGIKIWGRSSPWIDGVEIHDNFANPCAGAISVENRGYVEEVPLITNSIFRNNRAEWTGSAVDLYGPGNAAEIRNCLFVGNISNRGVTATYPEFGFHEEYGSGALTVFPGSRVIVDRCTFTGNYNGVDDSSDGSSQYSNCLFWKNDLRGGVSPGKRYEMDIRHPHNVKNCRFGGGTVSDLRGTISSITNVLAAPDPEFDAEYRPHAAEYAEVGYRPVDR